MTNINITAARKNMFQLANQILKMNDIINVSTKDGNFVMLSEEDYNSLIETLYFYDNPQLHDKIVNGLKTPLEECKEFNWREELK